MKINDVVLIQDDKITPRNSWKRGKVEELIVSRDSEIRGAVLRIFNKKKGLYVFIEETRRKIDFV